MTIDSKNEIKARVLAEPDFINSKKYRYSLSKYLKNNPVSANNIIAHLLCISEEDVERIYDDSVIKIRQYMKIEL